jgi:bacterioferritin-associated ferredoxin
MYACVCQGVTEADVRQLGAAGIAAPEDLIAVLSLNDEDCCGRCVTAIDSFVALAEEGAGGAVSSAALVAVGSGGSFQGAGAAGGAVTVSLVAATAVPVSGSRALG